MSLHEAKYTEKLWECLKKMEPEIVMDDELRKKALVPMKRMLEMSK